MSIIKFYHTEQGMYKHDMKVFNLTKTAII